MYPIRPTFFRLLLVSSACTVNYFYFCLYSPPESPLCRIAAGDNDEERPTGQMNYALGCVRILLWVVGLVWLAKTIVKPDRDEPLSWYDRTLRTIGVVLFLAFLAFGIPR